MSNVILPPDSNIVRAFQQMIDSRRIVFFAGLPGVGKSLLLKQLALMAHQAGRVVHSMQWDVSRVAFETDEILARYPEIDGVTHAAIRKAVGLWARRGVWQWHQQYPQPEHMLIGEVTLIGNRLVELAQSRTDETEPLLNSAGTLFVIPVPSRRVRQAIEAARARSIAQPQHEQEKYDAAPNVLQLLWREIYELGHRLGLVETVPDEPVPYNPDVYADTYKYLLQHRRHQVLPIDTLLPVSGSAYDLDVIHSRLAATPGEARSLIAMVEQQYTPEQLEQAVAQWYAL